MNLDLINLVKLQVLDLTILELRKIQTEGPVLRAAVENELEEFEQQVQQELDRERDLAKRRRDAETEIEDSDEKVKNNQARQLQVKTNEEYRALLKENDFIKKNKSALEDEVLEIMETLETLSVENKKLKVELEEKRAAAGEKIREIEARLAKAAKEETAKAQIRDKLAADIPKDFMAVYMRIYNHRHGRAVVGIIDGVCQECHMTIPPQNYNDLQRNEKLMTCPHCQRIIYWQDHQDFQNF